MQKQKTNPALIIVIIVTAEILGMNSEWAYIKWSVWVAQQWIDYYGYVSREFLSVGLG